MFGVVISVRVLPGDSNENKPLVGAEEEEVAKMGCPSLGEHTQLEVVIEESYEFKVRLHKHNMEFACGCEHAGRGCSAGGAEQSGCPSCQQRQPLTR